LTLWRIFVTRDYKNTSNTENVDVLVWGDGTVLKRAVQPTFQRNMLPSSAGTKNKRWAVCEPLGTGGTEKGYFIDRKIQE
jgi:hypothetical protein